MNKKVMAVAVAGALAAPAVALAQSATVNMYGQIRLENIYTNSYNQNAAGTQKFVKQDGFASFDSYIGFRGEEKLGGNLSAWFQCESTANVTGEEQSGFCGRNSAIGVKGAFGNFFVGGWDTPYKRAHSSTFRPFSTVGAFGVAELLMGASTGNGGNGLRAATNTDTVGTSGTGSQAYGFSRRQANSINYDSPNFGGFTVMGQVSAADESTVVTTTQAWGKARLWSVGALYQNGPLAIGAGYERHKNYNPGSFAGYTGGTDTGFELNAAYTFAGKFKLSGMYSRLEYDNIGSVNDSMKRDGWGVFGDWAISGPHILRMGYIQARDTKGNGIGALGGMIGNAGVGNTGGRAMQLQYAHKLSKRTEFNVGYVSLRNETNARYNLQSFAPRPGAGGDPRAFVLGAIHSF